MTTELDFDYFSNCREYSFHGAFCKSAEENGALSNRSPLTKRQSKTTLPVLSRWDRASRAWLSSGTFLLLFILFHALQVRNDLRAFTSTADEQICSACHVLENKVNALQASLDASASDVVPVSLKFVLELKAKLRRSFHFGAQIIGGRLRESILASCKNYWCASVGILVVFSSLLKYVEEKAVFLWEDNFIAKTVEYLSDMLRRLTNFMRNPEKLFADLLLTMYDSYPNETGHFAGIGRLKIAVLNICQQVRSIDFIEIHLKLRKYLFIVITALAMILILYNAITFVNEAESDLDNDYRETTSSSSNNKGVPTRSLPQCAEHRLLFLFAWVPFKSLRLLINWLLHFLTYQPFWIFFTMGVLGVLHLHFMDELIRLARDVKRTQVDPKIDEITGSFAEHLQSTVIELNRSWSLVLSEFLKSVTETVKYLLEKFAPMFTVIWQVGRRILSWVRPIFEHIKEAVVWKPLAEGMFAFVDCMILKRLRKYFSIGAVVLDRLSGSSSKGLSILRGGVMGLLTRAIKAIFRHLKRTAAIKKLFSASFLIFLKAFRTRSAFLFVYLMAGLVFLLQGILMAFVKTIFD